MHSFPYGITKDNVLCVCLKFKFSLTFLLSFLLKKKVLAVSVNNLVSQRSKEKFNRIKYLRVNMKNT